MAGPSLSSERTKNRWHRLLGDSGAAYRACGLGKVGYKGDTGVHFFSDGLIYSLARVPVLGLRWGKS